MPPVYVTSVIAPGGGVDSMWRMFGSSSVYDVTRTGFRVYQALAPSVLSPKEHQWRVNYFGYESNFCAVSPWGSWAAHCPCKFQIRRRTLLARKAGRACIKPPLAQNTLPCRCTSRTPTPAPATTRARTYTAAAVPTPAPTKAPLADVTVAIAISTETVNSFSGAEKLQFRVSARISVAADACPPAHPQHAPHSIPPASSHAHVLLAALRRRNLRRFCPQASTKI